jgi:hypothetical protein
LTPAGVPVTPAQVPSSLTDSLSTSAQVPVPSLSNVPVDLALPTTGSSPLSLPAPSDRSHETPLGQVNEAMVTVTEVTESRTALGEQRERVQPRQVSFCHRPLADLSLVNDDVTYI